MLFVGIAAALWTASGYVGAFMRASNKIYEVEEGRPVIRLRPLQVLVTLVLVVLLALVLVALVVTGPIASRVGSAIGASGAAVTAWDIAKWPVLLVVVTFMIAVLYYASPNVRLRGLKSIIPGSMLAVGVWLLASARLRVLRRELRFVQQGLRRAGRCGRVPGLAVDYQPRHPARR